MLDDPAGGIRDPQLDYDARKILFSYRANGTYAIMDGGTPENPSPHYVREMKRYGILPADPNTAADVTDVYATNETYWRSFWYHPAQP